MNKKTTLNQSFWVDEKEEEERDRTGKWLAYLFFYAIPSPRNFDLNNYQRAIKKYHAWCEKHGFEKTLSKSRYVLEEERCLRLEELKKEEEEKLLRNKFLVSKDQRVRNLFENIENQIKTNSHLEKPWSEVKKLRSSCIYSTIPFTPGATGDHSFILNAFFKLISYHDLFKCSLTEVKVKKSNPLAYFQKILSEVIEVYPQPKALLSWWFKPQNKWAQAYVNLAQGKKVYEVFKEVETLPLTHRQVHLLISKYGKQTLSYEKARLQSILATLKAPLKLENVLARSPLFMEELNTHYNLKLEFISFLAKNAAFFDWARTLDLWDYIIHLKDQNEQRAFSFKNRSLVTLIEGMQAWHNELGKSKTVIDDKRSWEKSGVGNYYFINENTTEELKIEELTSGREVHAEGKIMHHCVYSYVARCANQQCAIFSMKHKANHKSDWKNAGTIELNLRNGEIVQFKAKYNAKPEAVAEFHLRKWAEKENLRVR